MSLKFKLLATFIVLLPLMLCAAETPSALSEQRAKFGNFQLPSFYMGGEQTRFVWLNMPAFFHHVPIPATHTNPLIIEPSEEFAQSQVWINGQSLTLQSYVESDQRIDSMLVVHQGKIIFQRYNTHRPYDRHIIWSVTKVIVSTALAKLAGQGKLDLSAPVKMYLPSLADSDWADKTVQQVADMRSGMACNDSAGFNDPNNCVYRVDEIFGIMPKVNTPQISALEYLAYVPANPKATAYAEYNSANTLVLGFIIEAITQQPLQQALAELIWQPIGAEADALMLVNGYGESYAGGGISARLIDIARFGMLFTSHTRTPFTIDQQSFGLTENASVDSFSSARISSLEKLFDGDAPQHSKMQWDLIWSDGDMYKDGFSGQGVYVSPENDLVIVWFGTADTDFNKHHLLPIARQLSKKISNHNK